MDSPCDGSTRYPLFEFYRYELTPIGECFYHKPVSIFYQNPVKERHLLHWFFSSAHVVYSLRLSDLFVQVIARSHSMLISTFAVKDASFSDQSFIHTLQCISGKF